VEVWESPSDRGTVHFNGTEREGLVDVTVTGVEVVFDPAESGHRLNAYDGMERLASLTIMADEVVIRGPLRLPGTDVTVFARRLVFDDADPESPAGIDTSVLPTDWPKIRKPGVDGPAGERAGNVALYVARLEAPAKEGDTPGTKRFVMRGGNGGPAGPAVPGQDPPPPSYVVPISAADLRAQDRRMDARPGGKPGRGGAAGGLESSLPEAEALAERTGGAPGPETAGAPAGRVRYRAKGYRPPRRAGTPAPAIPGEPGEVPPFTLLGGLGSAPFAQPAILRAIVSRLRELYLAGEVEAAGRLALPALEWAPKVDFEDPGDAYDFQVLRSELITLAERLGSGLDYFGNPPGWVPLLSLEANYATFEEETAAAVRMMYLSHWLELYWEKQDERIAGLAWAIEEKRREIDDHRETLEKARALLPVLEKESEELTAETERFITLLGRREGEIAEKYARDKEREEMVRAAFEAMSSTALGLSFFNPAMAPVGGALILLEHTIYSEPPDVSGGTASEVFRGILEEDEIAEARERLAALDPGRAENAEAFRVELDAVSRDLSKATRRFVEQQIADALAGQVSTDFDAEIELNGILEKDAEFRRLFRELTLLVTKRQVFREKVVETIAVMDGAVTAMREAAWAADRLETARRMNLAKLDLGTRDVIRRIRRSAKERLVLYQYYLAKSFEYRMLETCPIDPQSNRLYEALASMFGLESSADAGATELPPFDADSSRVEDLIAIYREDLSRIVNITVKGLNSERFEPVVATYEIGLDAAEIEVLNRTGKVVIDLARQGVVFDADRNCRLVDVRVDEERSRFRVVDPPEGTYRANLDLTVEPPERSWIAWEDEALAFHYGRPRSTSLVLWGYAWRGAEGTGAPMRLSDNTRSILARLVDPTFGDTRSIQRIHFRPSAHGELVIRKDSASKPEGIEVRVEALSLTLEIEKNKSFRSP
jgi:hypothetical protein